MTSFDKPLESMSQQEAWELLQQAMRSGAVDPGIRREAEDELLAKARYTGLFPFKARLWWVLVSGVVLALLYSYFTDWKYWYLVLVGDVLFSIAGYKVSRAQSLASVRWVVEEDRIAFHGLVDSDLIRPRVNPKVIPSPLSPEGLSLLIARSRPG